jgi:hypothetical protein
VILFTVMAIVAIGGEICFITLDGFTRGSVLMFFLGAFCVFMAVDQHRFWREFWSQNARVTKLEEVRGISDIARPEEAKRATLPN